MMKTATLLVAFAILAAAAQGQEETTLSASASAATITYQGTLRDAEGRILASRQQTIEFRIYRQPGGGDAAWGRSIALLTDGSGTFTARLSDQNGSRIVDGDPLAKILADGDSSLFIGMTVAGGGEMAPRVPISRYPQTIIAKSAMTADQFDASGTSVTASKLDVGAGQPLATANFSASGNVTVERETTLSCTTVAKGDFLQYGTTTLKNGATLRASNGFAGYAVVPVGGIIAWYGDPGKVPDGWHLCDGQDGTPDLRERFIYGCDTNSDLGSGGEASVALTAQQIPSHTHKYSYTTPGSCNSDYMWVVVAGSSDHIWGGGPNTTVLTTHSTTGYDAGAAAGSVGAPHENMPQYVALCYIIRVK